MGSLAQEEGRLRRIFGQLLELSLALPLALTACSHGSHSSAADAGVSDPCTPRLEHVVFTTLAGNIPECRAWQELPCGVPPSVKPFDAGGCAFSLNDCLSMCPSYGAYDCRTADASCAGGQLRRDGPVTLLCDFCPGGLGRRPSGLLSPKSARGASALGDFFAHSAHLEAASVHAFAALGEALLFHDAPRELVNGARAALRDEVRHARASARLARRYGGTVRPVRVSKRNRVPAHGALALENATEGCVRETFAALVATWQAAKIRDPELATVMREIAEDETRHAALSWAIGDWLDAGLEDAARDAVSTAMNRVVSELRREVFEPPTEVASNAGVPSADEQLRLLDALHQTLWKRGFATK